MISWIWIGLWLPGCWRYFSLAGKNLLDIKRRHFAGVPAVADRRRHGQTSLHDRGRRSGAWALLMILAWMLLAGNWVMLPGMWQWVVGRFIRR